MSIKGRKPAEWVPGVIAGPIALLNPYEEELSQLAADRGDMPEYSADPPATADRGGEVILVAGGAGVADQLKVCLKAADGTYSWKTVVSG